MKKKPVEARLPRLNLGALAIATSCMMMWATTTQAATIAPKWLTHRESPPQNRRSPLKPAPKFDQICQP